MSERTKLIQPREASIVRRVLVKDGDRVLLGQVLVELDPTLAQSMTQISTEIASTSTARPPLTHQRVLKEFDEVGGFFRHQFG